MRGMCAGRGLGVGKATDSRNEVRNELTMKEMRGEGDVERYDPNPTCVVYEREERNRKREKSIKQQVEEVQDEEGEGLWSMSH